MHAFFATLTPATCATLAVGLLATVAQVAFALATSRLRLLLFSLAASVGFLVQYFLLGQWIGFYSGLVGTAYTLALALGYSWAFFQRRELTVAAGLGYVVVFATLTNWADFSPFEMIPLLAGVATLVALHSRNLIFTKSVFISAGVLWLAFELFNGMFTQMLGEGFELVGNAATLWVLLRASGATRRGLLRQPENLRSDLDAVDTELLELLAGDTRRSDQLDSQRR